MKILLVNPPALFSDGSKNPIQTYYPPLGLLYIASVVENIGYDVSVCDASINNMDFKQVRKELQKDCYDVIGITTFTGTRESAYFCAEIAKEENKESTIVLGGPHVTFLSEITLNKLPCVDVVVRGEGELTFLELVQKISKGESYKNIKGITVRDDNGLPYSTPDREAIKNLDTMPFPARHLVPMQKYFKEAIKHERHLRTPATTVITSRGCIGNCIFCSSPKMWGRRVRRRTTRNVIEEIEYLHNQYDVKDVFFMDDTFTINRKWVTKFCRELVQSEIDISWRCLGRVDTVDLNLLVSMKQAGCYHINYGIESGSQKTHKIIGKGIRIEQATKAIRLTKKAGLFVGADFMIGFPHETTEDMQETFRFIKNSPLDNFALNVPWILAGTTLYNQTLVEEKINETIWFESFNPTKRSGIQPSFPIYVPSGFTLEELLSIRQTMYSNLVSLNYLFRNMKLKIRTTPLLKVIRSVPRFLFNILRK